MEEISPRMIRQHFLVDLSLVAAVVLVACALAWSLHARSPAVPKVLAQTAVCGNGSTDTGEECDGGTKYEGGRYYRCVSCRWEQQSDDPIVQTNNNYCCLSNGRTARCVLLRTGEACVASPLESDVRLFSTAENNQRACETQRAFGTCTGIPASSRSSAQSSSAALCGNNVLESSNGEECDWGGNNSDSLPNRCRKNCTFPACGDGKVDDNFSDPVSGTMLAEECDNIEYDINGTQYLPVSSTQWAWNAHGYCNGDCTVKLPSNPLFFMFPKSLESPLYVVRNIFDWNSIFFPLSTLGF